MTDELPKVLFLSGKYRDISIRDVVLNIRLAEDYALRLWEAGFAVISPHMNTRLFDGWLDDAVWLRGDLAILERCDAIVMMENWVRSDGATCEHLHANEKEIPVFYAPRLDCHRVTWDTFVENMRGKLNAKDWQKARSK